MAWKTGRTRTLTANGTFTGTYSLYEYYPAPDQGGSRNTWFYFYAFGIELTASVQRPPTSSDWLVQVTVDDHITGAGASNYSAGFNGTYSLPGNSGTFTLEHDLSGTFSISVPVEEWMDVSVIARSEADQDAGIIDAPARLAVIFYEQTIPGTTAVATITAPGVTATTNGTVPSARLAIYDATATVNGDQSGTQALDASATLTAMGIPLSESFSTSLGASTATISGGPSIHFLGGIGTEAYGSATVTSAPPKTFNLNGMVYAVDQPYPGNVNLLCSRYAGDPTPQLTASPTFSTSYAQRKYHASVGISVSGVGNAGDGVTVNEWAPVSVTVSDTWANANGEYVGSGTGKVYDDAVPLHGWTFDGITLSQDPTLVLDDCTSATGWTGAATGGGGLQNTGTSMVRTFSPAKNLSGYRYLRVRMQTSSASHPFTVNIGGKTWTRSATSAPMDFDLDLCDPDNATATMDLTDTRWPCADPALGYGGAAPAVDGPLWGVGYTGGLTISGLDSDVTYTLTGLSQVRHTQVTAHFLPTHAPRFDGDMVQESPSAINDSDTTTDVHCRRFLMADTDGRQSLEYRDVSVSKVVGGVSDVTYYIPDYVPISDLGFGGGAASADAGYPSGQYPGWRGIVHAPDSDDSEYVHNGYLNSSSPSTWLMGGGLLYTGGAWQSGVGMNVPLPVDPLNPTDALTVPAQMLFDSIEWYPGIGDVFGLGNGQQGGALVLVAHKIFRAQSHGLLLTDTRQPATGQQVTLVPSGSTLQSNAVPVGWGKSGRPEGQYRTSGPSLIGETGGSPSSGTVHAVGQIATQTYQTRHLSRVALRGPVTEDCCDDLLFQTPMLHDPLPELPGDSDALPVDEWRR